MKIAKPSHFRRIVGFLAAFMTATAVEAATVPTMNWPEATGALVELRPKAISCAKAIKTYGKKAQIATASLDYADAKSDVDAAIATLIVASAPNAGDASLGALQAHMMSAGAKLEKFCAVARKIVPRTPGQKGWVEDLAKASIEPLIKAASDGVSALYTSHRKEDELTRQSIQTQLMAAKWPIFSEISANP